MKTLLVSTAFALGFACQPARADVMPPHFNPCEVRNVGDVCFIESKKRGHCVLRPAGDGMLCAIDLEEEVDAGELGPSREAPPAPRGRFSCGFAPSSEPATWLTFGFALAMLALTLRGARRS